MKRYTVVAAAVTLAAMVSAARAQGAAGVEAEQSYFSTPSRHRVAQLEVAKRNYVACLRHENDGVVESSLAHLVRMKMYMPQSDFSEVRALVNCLSVGGRTPAIRYKAYLASLVFDDVKMFSREARTDYRNADALFVALGERVQEVLIGAGNAKYVRPE